MKGKGRGKEMKRSDGDVRIGNEECIVHVTDPIGSLARPASVFLCLSFFFLSFFLSLMISLPLLPLLLPLFPLVFVSKVEGALQLWLQL